MAVDHVFSTCTTDTSGIFTRTAVDDSIGNDLKEGNIHNKITDDLPSVYRPDKTWYELTQFDHRNPGNIFTPISI